MLLMIALNVWDTIHDKMEKVLQKYAKNAIKTGYLFHNFKFISYDCNLPNSDENCTTC